MNKLLKSILALVVGVFVSTGAFAGQAGDGVNRLALQVSDNDPATLNKVLNVAEVKRGLSVLPLHQARP